MSDNQENKFKSGLKFVDYINIEQKESSSVKENNFIFEIFHTESSRTGKILSLPLTIKRKSTSFNKIDYKYSVNIDFEKDFEKDFNFDTQQEAVEKYADWLIKMGEALKSENKKNSFESVKI